MALGPLATQLLDKYGDGAVEFALNMVRRYIEFNCFERGARWLEAAHELRMREAGYDKTPDHCATPQ